MSEKNEENKPGLLERIEAKARIYNDKLLNYLTWVLVFCTAEMLLCSLLVQKLALEPKAASKWLLASCLPTVLTLATCAVCFVLDKVLVYQALQKKIDEQTGYSKYAVKTLLYLVRKLKFWAALGAIVILLLTSQQIDLSAVQQIKKEYNIIALALFAIAQLIMFSYAFYLVYAVIFYPLFFKPFEDVFERSLGFTLAPKMRFSLFAGGMTMFFCVLLIAGLIDLRVLELENQLLQQLAAAMKSFSPPPV
jgi:hypothetical protein